MLWLKYKFSVLIIIECLTLAHAIERCDNYFDGKPGQWADCPNYCCGRYSYRYCCRSCPLAYPSRSCVYLSTGAIIGIVIGGILAILAVIAVIIVIIKCCTAHRMAENAAMVSPLEPEETVITSQRIDGGAAPYQPGPPYHGGPIPPYSGAPVSSYPSGQPPPYGATSGYNQMVPAPNLIVANQSRQPPAPVIAPPIYPYAPYPLVMPVPIGGFGDYYHHHHDFGECGVVDAPIAVGNFEGGGGGVDTPLAVGNNGGDIGGIDAPIDTGFD